jgi:hypothetical protein
MTKVDEMQTASWQDRARAAVLENLVLAGGSVLIARRASAAPPTMMPSPGYDARLAESRRARAIADRAPMPIERSPRRHDDKRRLHRAR